MNAELLLVEDFGSHLADGASAAAYRVQRVEPYMTICPEVILDFTGVRSANSSFMNALISGLVENHGQQAFSVLVFKGCNPVLRALVEAALDLGLQKNAERICA